METLIAVDRALVTQVLAALEKNTSIMQELQDLKGERMLSEKEAAEYIGVAKRTLWDWRNRGLTYYQQGREIWYKLKDLDAWRERGRVSKDTAGVPVG